MPSFLDLPREIRDEIYTYCLVSPTGLIAPYLLPRSSTLKSSRRRAIKPSKSRQKQQLHLINDPVALTPHDPIFQTPDIFLSSRKSDYLSLSLRSTCRQIYNETAGPFWSKNIFHFEGLGEVGRGIGIARTLKVMGQTASRLIERVTIHMSSLGPEYGALRKVLNTLSSRARLGNFKRLELVWGKMEFWSLMDALYGGDVPLFDAMIEDLVGGLAGERFERVIKVPACPPGNDDEDEEDRMVHEEVVRCLHYAIGGTMICGDAVRWKDRVMVGI
ncbi:hypothetical protein ONS95_001768 [Cadophora gregata]|uniref:uncharacterized protein n=1 Tax=Cadophora gregata TaxID=51156 RepID=UPI0026DBB3C6|nr:uncharacterized protein ONS95_001768 [Cadophora gregata]KAK0111407.1 hypothetical protein ONS95_001768 [Cadophora gregata]KAK0112115.1 hypothetical protein ONS96_001373 [Cadophora gregata f. sp. sojae]